MQMNIHAYMHVYVHEHAHAHAVIHTRTVEPVSNVRQPSVYAAYLYDAVMIYAQALDEVLNAGGDKRNGTAIMEQIRGRRFDS